MNDNIKHIKRGIDVWQTPAVQVALEGETMTLQFKDPKGSVTAPITIPRAVANDLYAILAKACSVPGAVVKETGVVAYDPRKGKPANPHCQQCGGFGCARCEGD